MGCSSPPGLMHTLLRRMLAHCARHSRVAAGASPTACPTAHAGPACAAPMQSFSSTGLVQSLYQRITSMSLFDQRGYEGEMFK